jgi:hypothetical protein
MIFKKLNYMCESGVEIQGNLPKKEGKEKKGIYLSFLMTDKKELFMEKEICISQDFTHPGIINKRNNYIFVPVCTSRPPL